MSLATRNQVWDALPPVQFGEGKPFDLDLDPQGVRDVYSALGELIRDAEERAIVFVEHDVDAAADLATRVIVLDHDGRVLLDGPARQTLRQHAGALRELGVLSSDDRTTGTGERVLAAAEGRAREAIPPALDAAPAITFPAVSKEEPMATPTIDRDAAVETPPSKKSRRAARIAEAAGAGWKLLIFKVVALGLIDALALYAALVTDDPNEALLISVNHGGDSDSTASMCGNLVGALHGVEKLRPDWVERVQFRDVIDQMINDWETETGPNPPVAQEWLDRYPPS